MNPLQPYQYEGENRFAHFPPLLGGQYAIKRASLSGLETDQIHVRWHNDSSQVWMTFESLAEAIAFAEAEVIAHPISLCEIYDSTRGLVHVIWMDVGRKSRIVRMGWEKVLRENAPTTDCPECLQDIDARLAYQDSVDHYNRKLKSDLAERLRLAQGMPIDLSEKKSFDQALQRLRDVWIAAGGEGEVIFDDTNILASPRWWYIPFVWVGCSGFIVDRKSGHVNHLGSCHGLDLCFWAQDQGIVAGDTDFVIHEIRDMEYAQSVVRGFVHPNSTAEQARHYTKIEAAQALESLPAEFLSHELWFSFDAIREAVEAGAFTFSARPALHPRNRTGEVV
ncbi:hypothetical protein [Prosthecobacter sp.]|uniref:hypothetical protein n=1 Tax=Prosthecobacter sp. TaxID=1965333 RepID=UPI003784D226